jgi:putative ABC transport system permease protein
VTAAVRFVRQLAALLLVSLSGIADRLGSILTIVIGVTCAVGVLVSMLAMGNGARQQELGTARDDNVVMATAGTQMGQGTITKDEAAVVQGLPQVRKTAHGDPIVVPQSEVPIEGRRRGIGNRIYFPLVGVSPQISDATEMHFSQGRMFRPGLHELVASNPCTRQFIDFEIGARRPIHGSDWPVVGLFDIGEAQQCVVYSDVNAIMSTFQRNTYSSILVALRSPADYDAFRDAISTNPSLHMDVMHEKQALEAGFRSLNSLLDFASLFVGTIIAIGATLGIVNSLYSIVDSRRREMATVRAIGFGSGAVVASVLIESMLFALPGAVLGSALAWFLFNGLAASPFGYSFRLSVTLPLTLIGFEWALGMGLLGGLLPAWRSARTPLTVALRGI